MRRIKSGERSVVVLGMRTILLLLFCFFSTSKAFSQADSVKYTSDFKFKEGVYTDFSQVISNSPIPKGRIISEIDYNNNDFFDNVLARKELYYIDHVGNKVSVPTRNLWGYARNGFLYIKIDDGYSRITLIGSCAHFIAYLTYQVQNNSYPYGSSYGYPYSGYPNSTTTQTEMNQYLLDFSTGSVFEYNEEGVGVILMNDPELHDEYMALSKKKKKQLKFVFIRKYNQRNPLYLLK